MPLGERATHAILEIDRRTTTRKSQAMNVLMFASLKLVPFPPTLHLYFFECEAHVGIPSSLKLYDLLNLSSF